MSIHSIGLVPLSNTTARTLATVLKGMLIHCALPLSSCQGQEYDGAIMMMQGSREIVPTLSRKDVPSPLPVHCLVQSLELCLQGARRKPSLLKDACEGKR